jgi:hypothetical protein
MIINKEIDLGQGKIISIETGKMAKQADQAKKHHPLIRTSFHSRLNTAKNILLRASFLVVFSNVKAALPKKKFFQQD